MTSFTFSSRNEFKTCLAVLAVLAVFELLLYGSQDWLSKDARQLRALPTIAAAFREASSGKVLFLGNSLVREGVNLSVIKAQLEDSPLRPAILQKATADDSALVDWYYLYKNAFYRTKAPPNVLVVGFVIRQISDATTVKVDVIAGNMGGFANLPEIFQEDIRDISGRINYVLSSTSVLFANRERVRLRFGSMAIPYYEQTAQYFNRSFVSNAGAEALPSTDRRLQRLIDLCKQTNTLLVLVAMPIPDVYKVEDQVPTLLAKNGAVFLDLRRVDGLESAHFPDGYHLGEAGAEIYSRALATKLKSEPAVIAALGPYSER